MVACDIRLLGLAEERSIRGNESAVAGSEGALGMLAQAVNSNFQGFRQQPIVRIKENQVFTSALF